MSKPVVVAALRGGAHDDGTLAFALEYACRFNAVVRGVGLDGVSADTIHERLRNIVTVGVPEPNVDVQTCDGETAKVLLATASDAAALVIASPADDRTAADDPLLVDLRRSASCLLLEVSAAGALVRATGLAPQVENGRSHRRRPPLDMPVVTVGFDASASAHDALAWALRHAAAFGAHLELVTAIPPQAWSAETRRDAAHYQRTAIEMLPAHATSISTAIVRGETVDVLMRLSEHAQLLVLGRHSSPGPLHTAPGSVTDACTRVASCPVVVVAGGDVAAHPSGPVRAARSGAGSDNNPATRGRPHEEA